jgi:rod shape-determining protein MreB and related proteins
MPHRLPRWIGPLDVALDLGSSEQRLYVPGCGVAVDAAAGGSVRRGVVVHAVAAAARIRPRLRVARRFGLLRPHVLACVPSSLTSGERTVVDRACEAAGASSVSFVSASLAAAIGAGIDVSLPYAQAIVDVGDGLTDFAVIRDGEVVEARAAGIALSDLRASLRAHLFRERGIRLADAAAARMLAGEIRGVDRVELERTIEPALDAIVGFVARAFRELPEGLGCEVIETGLALTGGGAGLPVVARRIAEATAIDVRPAAAPAHAAIRGAAQIVESA